MIQGSFKSSTLDDSWPFHPLKSACPALFRGSIISACIISPVHLRTSFPWLTMPWALFINYTVLSIICTTVVVTCSFSLRFHHSCSDNYFLSLLLAQRQRSFNDRFPFYVSFSLIYFVNVSFSNYLCSEITKIISVILVPKFLLSVATVSYYLRVYFKNGIIPN